MLTCVGKAIGKRTENGDHLTDLEVDVLNQEGQSTAPGEATVAPPRRRGDESNRAGIPLRQDRPGATWMPEARRATIL